MRCLSTALRIESSLRMPGYQGYLLRFASRQETLIEFPHYRVAARGDKGAHVQRRSDLSSTTPHTTTTTEGARVTV